VIRRALSEGTVVSVRRTPTGTTPRDIPG
jgi:hypothetical protein